MKFEKQQPQTHLSSSHAQTQKKQTQLIITFESIPTMSLEDIKADIKAVVAEKNCGPIFIRLSWHDAGVYSTGKLTGGKLIQYRRYYAWLIKVKSRSCS